MYLWYLKKIISKYVVVSVWTMSHNLKSFRPRMWETGKTKLPHGIAKIKMRVCWIETVTYTTIVM